MVVYNAQLYIVVERRRRRRSRRWIKKNDRTNSNKLFLTIKMFVCIFWLENGAIHPNGRLKQHLHVLFWFSIFIAIFEATFAPLLRYEATEVYRRMAERDRDTERERQKCSSPYWKCAHICSELVLGGENGDVYSLSLVHTNCTQIQTHNQFNKKGGAWNISRDDIFYTGLLLVFCVYCRIILLTFEMCLSGELFCVALIHKNHSCAWYVYIQNVVSSLGLFHHAFCWLHIWSI